MNILTGLNLKGFILETAKNYRSVPGLAHWIDSRQQVILEGGEVQLIGDKSIIGNNVFAANTTRRVQYVKSLWLQSKNVNDYLLSNSKNYSFLHNGGKFGIYQIAKTVYSLATPGDVFGAFGTAASGQTGIHCFVGTTSSGRFGFVLRGGATEPTFQVANLLNPSHANYTPSSTIVIQGINNFGQTLGGKIRFGNVQLILPKILPNISDYPTAPNSRFFICNGGSTVEINLGLQLIYDWSGLTDQQAVDADGEVMEMLERDKIIFQQMDA